MIEGHEITVGRGEFEKTYILQGNRYFIEFNRGFPDEVIDAFLASYSLKILEIPQQRKERLPEEVILKHRQRRWVEAAEGQGMMELYESGIVNRIAPMFREMERDISSSAAPLPDVLLVETSPEDAEAVIKALEAKYPLQEVAGMSRLLGNFLYFVLQGDVVPETAVYDLLAEVGQEDGVTYAEFDWAMQQPDTVNPSDALWDQQWNMVRINAGGDGTTGWDLATGDPNVVIAIIDSGCDLSHPDLTFTPPDTHFNAEELADGIMANFDASPVRTHGTAVAGIAAAKIDNAGVAGVAGDCLILPAYHGDTAARAATAVNWAVDQGARVINMSCEFAPIISLISAIENADNEGVVVVASAGNDNIQEIIFPAAHPTVIAVGAIDHNDARQADVGTHFWGSNWGPELNVMAPGLLIPTTDLQGGYGYNEAQGVAGDYYGNFGATSAAAPHVAGLAALLIAHCPDLDHHQVRMIIETTCQKIQPGTYNYIQNIQHGNGTWHQEMGYGLIDVVAALQACTPIEDEDQPIDASGQSEQPITEQGDDNVMNGNSENQIVDENGNLRAEFLDQGTLLTRYVLKETTGNIDKIVLTWVPDDPDQDPVRDVIDIPDQGPAEYRTCLATYANQGIKAVFTCAGRLAI